MTQLRSTDGDITTLPDLDAVDAVIVDHDDLDTLYEHGGGKAAVHEAVTVFTDDAVTRNTVDFNLVVYSSEEDASGVVTQIADPIDPEDTVVDLRTQSGSFSDWLCGLVG